MAKLTEKQALFVQEYLVDLNATQAAIRAGYSEKTAEQMGYQLLQKTSVSEKIKELMAEREERTGITQDKVLDELAEVGFAKKNTVHGIRMKMSDKIKALELLGRHLGMFLDKVETTGSITVEVSYDYGEED